MNKKFAVGLILPLLLVPLASFGVAHLYDDVQKRYKLYIGTMNANLTYFHVDNVTLIDKDNDGFLFDDELKINITEEDGIWKVHILVDPVSPGFVLNTTMEITNDGELPWTVTWKWDAALGPMWDNSTTDPCWTTKPTKDFPMWPSDLWSWEIKYYKEFADGTRVTADPTEHFYKPGDKFIVVQHINLKQPADAAERAAYKKIMGTWFYIWEIFCFETEDPITKSSWTYPPTE